MPSHKKFQSRSRERIKIRVIFKFAFVDFVGVVENHGACGVRAVNFAVFVNDDAEQFGNCFESFWKVVGVREFAFVVDVIIELEFCGKRDIIP